MYKVLVADDSTTIQKVIKMTLDQSQYEVLLASSEQELLEMIDDSYSLLLFDYTLSPTRKGEELAQVIHDKVPEVKIIAMLSTFDKVDQGGLKEVGVLETVTKPFDSNLFITMVDRIVIEVDSDESETIDSLDDIENEVNDEHDIEDEVEEETISPDNLDNKSENIEEDVEDNSDESIDEWKISSDGDSTDSSEIEDCIEDSSSKEKIGLSDSETTLANTNDLEVVLNDWGIEIPSSIDTPERVFAEVPPVIEDDSSIETEVIAEATESINSTDDKIDNDKIPADEDLEYPDPAEFADLNLSSRPISLDELQQDSVPASVDDEETDPNIKISDFQDNLEELVSDEVEDELWSVDEGLKVENIEPRNLEELDDDEDNYDPTAEVKEDHQELSDEIIDAAVDETMQTAMNSFNREEFINEIKEELKKDLLTNAEFISSIKQELLAELLTDSSFRDRAQEEIRKVAWEVIPDLAENLIRSEIKRIAESV